MFFVGPLYMAIKFFAFFFRQSVLSDVFGLNGRHHWQLRAAAQRCGAGGCRREATWITWAVMPDEKMGFTFNLLQSCWGFAAPQIEAITDQRPASGWHISWRRAAGSNHQNQRFIRGPLEWWQPWIRMSNNDKTLKPKKVNGCVAPFKEKETLETLGFFSLQLDPSPIPHRPHQGPNLSSSERCQICSTCHRASAWSFAEIWGNV